MIDAHLLLNLGRPDGISAPGEGSPLLTAPGLPSPMGGKFADALRQVHAEGRQDLAGAPMQLRIIGSTLRVVTPARLGSEVAQAPSPNTMPTEGPEPRQQADLQSLAPEAAVAPAVVEGSALVISSPKPEIDSPAPMAEPGAVGSTDPLASRSHLAPLAETGGVAPFAPKGSEPRPSVDPALRLEAERYAVAPSASKRDGLAVAPTPQPNAGRPQAEPLPSSAVEREYPLGEVRITAPKQQAGAELKPSAMEPKGPAPNPEGEPLKQVALGAAAALSLRESFKASGDRAPKGESVTAAPPITQKPSKTPSPRLAEGWTFKQRLQGQERLGAPEPLDRPSPSKPPPQGDAPKTSAAPLMSQLVPPERRELDLVALAKAAPLEGPDGGELSEKFAAQVAQRVVAQAAAGQLTSRVALNPAQLGPLEIRLQLHGDRLAVDFQVQHALTRELLADGLGRLREGLEQAGFEVTRLAAEGRGGSVPSGQPSQGSWAGTPSEGQVGQGFAQSQGGGGFAGREREGASAQDQHAPLTTPQDQGHKKDGSGLDITV